MKTTLKSRLRSIIILGFIVVASLFISMWQLFGLHGISVGAAYTQANDIANAMNGAASDWKTKTDIEVGDETNQNGSVVTIDTTTVRSIVVPTGAQVTIDSVEPSVKRELENDATYSQLNFDVPVTVSAESVLTINTDVVFRGGVNVYGTLIIGGMAFNQSSMLIANKANSYAEIDSQGVIVKGSLNNDAARNGSININAGATLTIAESTETSYTDADVDKNFSNHDGGALFLKAEADGKSLGLTVDGNIANGGSIIYESGAAWSGTNVIGDGAIVSAAFVSELSEISGTVVLYPDIASGTYAAGTSFTLGNSSNRNWSNVTLLSFGRTILKNGANDVSYNLTNVNLGGGTSGEKTFTQGANELIFDGGAQWTNGNASGYSLSFISGEDASAHTAYRNDGVYSSSALINVSDTLNTYSGVKITRHETRAGESKGGGVNISNWATLTMYGGEVSYNAVTRCSNNGAGGGIFASPNSKINIYNGLVTRNALANYQDNVATYSADGAGIAINGNETEDSSVLTIFGGEISYNCGAQGSTGDTNAAADGGGVIGRVGATVRLYGGAISNNWTGGFGGAVLLWSNSKLEMTGGEISGNYAAFGGGINMTTNSTVDVSGGQISGNTAFYNNNSGRGGYGGGICVGAKGYETSCSATISGNSIISENSAVYGGGLAVYTRAYKGILNSSDHNILTMTGGTITNNSVHNANSDNMGSNGNGVYVAATGSQGFLGSSWEGPILYLSGNATIDSSNNVSFYIEDVNNAGAPISVSGELTGSGLAALVYLDNPGSWTGNNIVSYASGVTADRNKFLLDDTTYTFYEVTSNVDYLRIQNVEDNQDYVASISGKGNYSSLEDAVAAAADGDTITVLRSATISQSMQVSGKNITIVPASGEDITLGVASDFTVTGTGATDVKSLFIVSGGGSLTIGNNEENTKIAFDGNKSSGKDMSMVYVAGGSFTLGENATLRNNNSTGNAGALYLGQGTSATIKGTIADTSGTYGAIYINAGGSIILDGATFSGNCSDSNGNNYAVYAVGNESTVKLDGEVAFGGNAVYTENKINLGDSFKNGGATIGVTFPAARTAGTTIVEIPQTFVDGWQNAQVEGYESAAQYVSAQFNVVNMDSDYMLILSTQSTTTANALVVSKSVVFVFDFTYSNGFNEGSTQIGISQITFKGIHEVLSPTVAEQFAGRIHTRGNLVVLELQSGSNFPLDEFLGYASRSGHSLISWQVNGTSTKYNYNGNLAYLDSEDEVSVRSVWVENTYNIAFNNNSATFGQGVTFGGKMDNQEITSNTQDKITLNAYTLVGYAFKEWNTQSDGEGTKYAIDAVANFSQLTADAPVYEYDSSGIITKAVYNITLYAQWECIFSGGEGTAANPFIINNVKDLYILEATVNGTESGTDNAYAVPNTYFNTNDDEGIATYLPESYEGYYFKLSADNFDNAASPFKGVIGRISSSGDGSKDHEKQEANITAAVYGENATIGGTGAAAGNAFKGYFDGNGKTIALNINKQKVENYTGAEGYENGDETLVGVGLFGYADHATIRNVNLSGSVHGYAHVGGLVGYAFGGNISNIYTSADVTSGGHDVGGVIGTFYEVAKNYAASSVTDAVNIGSVSYAPRERDNLAEELDIEDNWNELGVMDDAQGVRFGGIVGAGVTLRLTGGYNLGNITARYGIGGVVGTLRSLDNSTTNYSLISQSFNTGEITATAGLYASSTSPNNYVQDFVTAYTGGITGRLVGRSSVNTSFNAGKVTSTYVAKVSDTDSQFEYVGMDGFLGIEAGDSATYIGARGVGGIVGFTSYDPSATSQSGRMSISNVYNTGDVYSFAGVGGIAGYLAFGNISEVFNGGNITAYGTHYDAASQSRVNGGYMLSTGDGGETIYVAYLGAIVGRGINASLTATVSFNMNSTYSGYTDPTVQAVGDSGYNAQFGFGANSSSAKALASSQMRVVTQGTAPSGFDPTFDGGAWSFKMHNDTYSYYPQLSVFADSSEAINVADESGEGFESKNISTISQESAKIKYRTTDEEQGEVDKPVEDNKAFKLIFNLGGGSFIFSSTSTGEPYSFTGKHKHYYASGSDYYYLFTFPTDKTDYGTGTEAGGTDELEMPDDPVRTGYTFAGWYIDAGCTQEFNFEAIPGQDTTIYAKWEAVIYTITYENVVGVGGTWSGVYNKTFSILTVDEVSLPTSANLSRRGYEFVGWKYSGVNDYITSYLVSYGEGKPSVQLKNSSGSIVAIVAFEDLTAGTLVLTAEWGAEKYTIEYRLEAVNGFVGDGLSATLSGQTTSYTVASGDIALPEPVRTGYDFTGWKLVSIDGSTEITDDINRTYYTIGGAIGHIRGNTVGDFVLQAVWQINTIRLELDARGGKIADTDIESYLLTYDPATGLYYKNVNYYTQLGDVLVKDGKWVSTSGVVGNEFNGWYVSSTASGNPVDETTPVSAGSGRYTLYAGYKTAEYTITVQFGTAGTTPVTVKGDNKDYLIGLGFVFSEDDTWATLKVTHGYDATEKLSPLSKALVIAKSYYFSSWEVVKGSGSIYNVTGDLTITAEYVQNRVTVNFVGFNGELCGSVSVPVGGSIAGDGTATKAYETLLAKINETTVPGYTFKGEWTYSGDTFDKNTVVTSSMVVYAVYEAWDVNVNFYLVDGDEVSEPFTFEGYAYEFGSPFGAFPSMAEIINKNSAYIGYRIDGVYLKSGLTNDVNANTVIAASMFDEDTTADSCNLNLYIKVSKENYSIIFNANGGAFGSATTVSGTYQYDGAVSYGQDSGFPVPTRTGYEFVSWYISGTYGAFNVTIQAYEDYTQKLMEALKEKGYTGTLNAIANWTEEVYDVWFYAGADDAYFVIPQSPVDGVTFYNEPNGEAVISGTAKYCVVKTKYDNMPSVNASVTVERKGYTFSGWLTYSNSVVTAVHDNSTYTSSTPIKANWTVGRYSIVFITNGGSSVADKNNIAYGENLASVLADVRTTRTGYTLDGWYTDSNLSVSRPDTMPDSTLVLYAKWTEVKNTLTLTITLPEGVTSADSAVKVAVDTALRLESSVSAAENVYTVTISGVKYGTSLAGLNSLNIQVEETSYAVVGMWQSGGMGVVLGTMPETAYSASATFEVKAEATGENTVIFYRNYGTEDENNNPVVFYTLTQSGDYIDKSFEGILTPTREGYTFIGWFTDKSGGSQFVFGENGTSISGGCNLYAHWQVNIHTVTYKYNDGATADETKEIEFGTSLNDSAEDDPSRDGYIFKGWCIDSACTVSATTMPDSDITLYAKWEAVGYKLIFVYYANGDDDTIGADNGAQSEWKAEIGTAIPYPDADIKPYYALDGWYIQGSDKPFNYANMPNLATLGGETDEDNYVTLTIYAKYSAIEYTVDYIGDDGSTLGELTVSAVTEANETDLKKLENNKPGYEFVGWNVVYQNVHRTDHVYIRYSVDSNGIYLIANEGTGEVESVLIGFEYLADIDLIAVFKPEEYTLILNANYDGSSTTASVVYGSVYGNALTTPERAGYSFVGWFTQSEGGEKITSDIVVSTQLVVGDTITLYAQWKANTYYLVFNGNGGTGTIERQTHSYDETFNLPGAASFTRPGYEFSGWKIGDTPYKADAQVSKLVAEDGWTLEVIAQWTPISTTITFNANGGKGEMQAQSFTYGQSVTLNANKFTKEGYHFLGWATPQGSDKVVYVDGATISNITESSLTLYAVWKANTYTVVFNANGGTGTMDPQSFAYGESKALTANVFSRTGYTFLGWAITDSATEVEYNNNESVNNLTAVNGATVTLYAVWEANGYTVIFNANGGDVTGSMTDQPFKYGTSQQLTANAFSRTGYTFLGWATTDNADTEEFKDGQSVINLTAKDGATVTLYAVWKANSYTVTFNTDGGSAVQSQTVVYNGKATRPVSDPEKVGYTFKGWFEGEGKYNFDNAVTADIELTAKWEINTYTVTFMAGEGQFSYDNIQNDQKTIELEVQYGGNAYEALYKLGNFKIIAPEDYIVEGFEVVGGSYSSMFYVTKELTVTITYSKTEVIVYMLGLDGTVTPVTVYINGKIPSEVIQCDEGYKWINIVTKEKVDENTVISEMQVLVLALESGSTTVNVTLDLNGGELGSVTSITVTFGEKYSNLKTPTREGYTFLGWWTNDGTSSDGWGEQITSDTKVTRKDHTLYARWQANTYTVIFDANGGTGTTTMEVTYDGHYKLPDAPTRTGYTFDGWFTGKDNSGTPVTGETSFNTAGNVTLYAHWTAIPYTVTFDDNYSDGEKDTISVTYGDVYGNGLKALTREGYNFLGWWTNDGSTSGDWGTQVTADTIVSIADDHILYAKWQKIQYTVYFFNGNELVNSGTYSVGDTVSVPDMSLPEKAGYTFSYWEVYSESSYVEFDPESMPMPAADLYLYAHWTAITCTVTLDDNYSDGEKDTISVTYGNIYGNGLKALTREGYNFLGWWTDDGTSGDWGTQITANTIVSATQNHTLYARWQIKEFKVILTLTLPNNVDTATINELRTHISNTLENKAKITNTESQITVTLTREFGFNLGSLASLFGENYSQITVEGQPYLFVWDNTPSGNLGVNGAAYSGRWTNSEVKTVTLKDGDVTLGTYYVTLKDNGYTLDLNTVTKPAKTGSVFTSWLVAEGEGSIQDNILTITSASVTLTAQWEAITYTVIYGGEGISLGNLSFNYDGNQFTAQGVAAELAQPQRTGYAFMGWKYGDDVIADTLAELFSKTNLGDSAQATVEISLTAEWSPNTYTVVFNANGATGDMLPQSFTYGTSQALIKNAFSRTGYTFLGWAKTNDAKAEEYADNASVNNLTAEDGATVTLYAVWQANGYTVTFDANGEGVTGEMQAQSFTYGQSVTLNANNFEREGYHFLGWSTSKESNNVVYADKAEIGSLQSTGLTLYAVWEINTYTVTFNTDGGSAVQSQTVAHGDKAAMPESAPEKDGYKFAGWYVGETEFKFEETEITENITITAKWVINSYTVSFNSDGGSTVEEITVNHGEKVTAPKVPTKDGYAFAGWYVGETAYDFNKAVTADVALTAKWNAIEYTISYVLNGGTNADDAITTFTVKSGEITLLAPTREGYSFDGWYNAEIGGDKVTVIEAGRVGNITLYARWTTESHTVSFNSDGGSTVDNITVNHGEKVTAPKAPTKDGYAFAGWYVGDTAYDFNTAVTADVVLTAKWDAIEYTISYVLNGGTNADDAITTFTVKSGEITLLAPTREGYSFDGWYNAEIGGDKVTVIEAGRVGNITLYARWTTESHTVSFNSDGGSTVDNITVNHGEKVTAPKAPTKDGYAFAGWYVGETAYDFNTAVTADVALTAKWNAIEYTISYVLNGGTNADDAITTFTVKSGEITLLAPTREGYSFDGWYNAEIGGDKVTVIEAGRVGNITLYARWTVNRYSVTLNGANVSGSGNGEAEHGAIYTYKLSAVNGYSLPGDVTIMIGDNLLEDGYSYDKASGVITIEAGRITDDVVISANGVINTYTVTFNTDGGSEIKSQTVDHGDKAAMPESAPEKDGYKFAGWYVGETEFKFDETDITENITITAKWVINTYTVSFNSDGGSTVDNITVNHGEKVTAPEAPTKDGYAFAGWYVGDTAYDFNTAVTADVELTAKWNAIEYTISYVLNGGTNADDAITTFTVKSGEITLLAPTREGYSFDGWYNAEIGGDKVTVIEAGRVGNITLYARWTTESHTVSFNSDGGSTVDNITVNHGEKVTAPKAPTKDGYAFAGWYVGETAYDFNTAVTADVALTAKWNAIEYTISYVLNGGTNADDAITTFTVKSGEITLLAPTREGYSFDGWYNAEIGGDKVTVIEAGRVGNITLYARWTTESHTVSFNSDGGSTVDNITVNHGEKVTAPKAPTKDGYAFAGWYVGDTAYDFNTAVTADVVLTAKWDAIEYTISYVLNGGMNDGEVITEYTIESDTIVHPVPVRDGYTFLGWFDAEVGGNKSETIESGSTGHVTLYAVWRIDSVEVSFEANGGSLDDGAEVQKVDYGNTVAFVEPVRENYLFLGWYTDEALTQSYDFNSAVTQSFTLYAKWRLQQVVGQAPDGTTITVSSDSGFDDGTMLRFTELSDESSISQASGSLTENMTLKRLYDIELVRADGSVVPIEHMLSVGISAEGLGDANGKFVIVYVPDDGGEAQQLATHIGSDGKLYFFIEHFSFYAIVDMTDIVPQAGFAWWWILVAIGGCALIAIIALIIARNNRRYELNYVNGGIPSVKLRESKLIDLPIPERESEVFEGWYYDEDFRDRAFLTSMPKQNLILYAKWRTMTQDERMARDKARAEAAATKKSDDV